MSLTEEFVTTPKCHDCQRKDGTHAPGCSALKVPSTLDVFDKEIATITQRRGDIYGHPADDFTIAAALMAPFDKIDNLPLRHALRMICVKLARLTTTPNHLDSYVDIVGYARCAVMVLQRQDEVKNITK